MRILRFTAAFLLVPLALLAAAPASQAATSDRVLLSSVSVEGIRDEMPIACVTTPCEPIVTQYLVATVKIPKASGGTCFENLRGRLVPQTGSLPPALRVTAVKEVGVACESTGGTATVRVELPSTMTTLPPKVREAKTGTVLPVPVTVAK